MSLQLSVYWRLALLFLITPLIFYLDIFTKVIVAARCRHSNLTDTNGSLPPSVGVDQPRPVDGDADGWMKNGARNVSDNLKMVLLQSLHNLINNSQSLWNICKGFFFVCYFFKCVFTTFKLTYFKLRRVYPLENYKNLNSSVKFKLVPLGVVPIKTLVT